MPESGMPRLSIQVIKELGFCNGFNSSSVAHNISRLSYVLNASELQFSHVAHIANTYLAALDNFIVVCCTDTACTGTRGLVFIPYMS